MAVGQREGIRLQFGEEVPSLRTYEGGVLPLPMCISSMHGPTCRKNGTSILQVGCQRFKKERDLGE